MTEAKKPFWNDLVGVFRTPGATLGAAMKMKNWVPAFLLLAIVTIIFTYIVYPTQIEKVTANPDLSEDAIAMFRNNSGTIRIFAGLAGTIFLFIGIALASFFVYLFFGVGGSDGNYSNFFYLTVNASLIDTVIPSLINIVLILLGKDMLGSFSLALLVPGLEAGTFLSILLAKLDIFSIWYIYAISAGVSVFSKLKLSKCLTIGFIFLVLDILVSAAFIFLARGLF